MNINRKTFLRNLSLGLAGAGATRALAQQGDLPTFVASNPRPFWAEIRRGYDIEPGFRYLNSGGLGPCSRAVKAYATQIESELEARVETGHDLLAEARIEVAKFLGAAANEVAFVRNATEANGIIAGGIELKPGDEVIFESHAHPGGSFPWLLQAEKRGVKIRLFEPDPESISGNIARIEKLITPRTRAVQVSHITAPTGILLPVRGIAALCKSKGLWFHVDGAQSAGMVPIDFAAMGCDSYATSGHKWVGAPRETGVLLVKYRRQDDVKSVMVGAYSAGLETLPGQLDYYPGAMRFEYGTRDVPRIMGMAEAMRVQEVMGRDRIAEHGRALVAHLREGLEKIPSIEVLSPRHPELGTSMLSFRTPRLGYREMFSTLVSDYGLRCRPVSEQGLDAVRVSCHIFNTVDDIDHLIHAIEKTVASAA